MAHSFSLRLLLVACFVAAGLAVPRHLSAQDAMPPAPEAEIAQQVEAAKPPGNHLDSILAALEANIADYNRSIPSFLCKEHVVSEMGPTANATGSLRKVTDSTFRISRSIGDDGQTHLDESRVLTAVDGKPPRANNGSEVTSPLAGPIAVFGIFGGALNLVATSGKACFRYRLHPAREGHQGDKIVIDFEDLPARDRDLDCPYTDKTSGRVLIQPSTMRVVRLEAKMRDHPMQAGVKDTWEWSIDYTPITLGGKSFWMPAAIHSKAVPNTTAGADFNAGGGGGTGRRGSTQTAVSPTAPQLTYTLEAKYSEYHRMDVVSRIVPVTGDEGAAEPGTPGPATALPPGP